MAGLNSLVSDTTTSATTLPSWYDTAQQSAVQQATSGAAAMPQLQNTVAGGAIQNLSGANNPFFTAQNQLTQIGSGAANPWIVDQSTGQVTPDTSTALGGLFAAQNQQLNQLLPSTIAPVQAGAIGSGNFGSLRGQTAVDKAKADALANLQAQQMQAALQSQQTGVNAAQALSNVAGTGTTSMTQLGQAQQASPLKAVTDLTQILGNIKAPATVTESAQLSPLSQLGSLGSAFTGGVSGLNSLIGSIFPYQTDASGKVITDAKGNPIKATIGSLGGLSGLFSNIFGSGANTSTDASGNRTYVMPDGSTTTDQSAYQQAMQDQAAQEQQQIQDQIAAQEQAAADAAAAAAQTGDAGTSGNYAG